MDRTARRTNSQTRLGKANLHWVLKFDALVKLQRIHIRISHLYRQHEAIRRKNNICYLTPKMALSAPSLAFVANCTSKTVGEHVLNFSISLIVRWPEFEMINIITSGLVNCEMTYLRWNPRMVSCKRGWWQLPVQTLVQVDVQDSCNRSKNISCSLPNKSIAVRPLLELAFICNNSYRKSLFRVYLLARKVSCSTKLQYTSVWSWLAHRCFPSLKLCRMKQFRVSLKPKKNTPA